MMQKHVDFDCAELLDNPRSSKVASIRTITK